MNHLSLYNLSTEYQYLLGHLYDEETGEIDTEAEKKFGEVVKSTQDKCIAIASWVKKMQADKREVALLKQEIANREAAFDKQIGRWESYLISNMEACQTKEISCPLFSIRLKKNPYSTDIINEEIIPAEFIKSKEIVKVEEKPDKNAIKEAFLRTGEQVPGTFVAQKTKLEICIDKI